MKFYYLWQYVEWGGAQILLLSLMKEAKKHGEVKAVIPEKSNQQLLRFLDNLNVSAEFFAGQTDLQPAPSLKRKLERHWNKLSFEYRLTRFLKKFDLSDGIVHTEFAPWQSMLMLLWLCRQTKVFVTMHNSLPTNSKFRNLLWKIKFGILSRSKNFHLFTANEDTKNSLKPLVGKDFYEKVKVTYASIDRFEVQEALDFQPDRTKISKKYDLPADKFLVFCVGQFIDRKGRWVFLEAARKLLETNDDIAFVWISNSRPTAEEFAKAESYGLGENFIFLSSDQIGAEHIDLFKLLRIADVFALPSYLEGLPISIIEALALGIPTISTNINAIPEAVIHLETGLLIEPGNSDQLCAAIQKLKNEPALRKTLAARGQAHALENFDERNVAKIVIENYLEAFGRA